MQREHLDRADAEKEVARRFGSVDEYRRQLRAIDSATQRRAFNAEVVSTATKDVVAVVRGLIRAPGFTATAILTLACGVAANAVIFGAVDTVVLHPVPATQIQQLAIIETNFPAASLRLPAVTPGEFYDLAERHDLFLRVGGYRATSANLSSIGEPQRIAGVTTLGAFFELLGARPYLGRLYDSSEVTSGDSHIAVLSYAFWRSLTGGNPALIGASVRLQGEQYRIVGVLAPDFRYPVGTDLWTPHPLDSVDAPLDRDSRGAKLVTTIVRLRPGTSPAVLQSRLDAAMAEWQQRLPQFYPQSVKQTLVVSSFTDVVAGSLQPLLMLLLSAVGVLLLVVCANLACLQLVRTAARSKEQAVRAALGASRWQLARRLLLECIVIAVSGGVAGLLVATVLLRFFPHFFDADSLALLRVAHTNLRVVTFSASIAAISLVLFAAWPALRSSRADAGSLLRDGATRGATGDLSKSRFLRNAVIVEIALAVALLMASGVATRSLSDLIRVDPGFRARGLIAMRVVLPSLRYQSSEKRASFRTELVERIRALPGVEAVSVVSAAPFGHRESENGRPANAPRHRPSTGSDVLAKWWSVDSTYFRSMGIPLRAGRSFETADSRADSSPVVIIDDVLAQELYPGEAAVGKSLGPWVPLSTIVGVVGSVHGKDLSTTERGAVYSPILASSELSDLTVVCRTPMDVAFAATALRGVVRQMDPELPVAQITALSDDILQSLGPRRVASTVLDVFAFTSLLLAMLGIYGVLSYSVNQRTREFGIRIALGAQPATLVGQVIGSGVRLALAGIAAGMIVYLAATRLMSSLVFGVSACDPLALGAGPAIVAFAVLVACFTPAYRASMGNPNDALRAE